MNSRISSMKNIYALGFINELIARYKCVSLPKILSKYDPSTRQFEKKDFKFKAWSDKKENWYF
jgi:hypothetical protein